VLSDQGAKVLRVEAEGAGKLGSRDLSKRWHAGTKPARGGTARVESASGAPMASTISPVPCSMRVELAAIIAAARFLDQTPCEQYPHAIYAPHEHRKREDQGRTRTPRKPNGQPQAQNRSDHCPPPVPAQVPLHDSAHTRLPAAFYANRRHSTAGR
jgi:hypothetical protein